MQAISQHCGAPLNNVVGTAYPGQRHDHPISAHQRLSIPNAMQRVGIATRERLVAELCEFGAAEASLKVLAVFRDVLDYRRVVLL